MSGLSIEDLVGRSVYILRNIDSKFDEDEVIQLCSWGKDSVCCLALVREAFTLFGKTRFPWKVVHIDTGKKFPEMYEFRDKLQKEWGFDLEVIKGEGVADPEEGRLDCCQRMKTDALKNYIKDNGIKAVIVSIRRDEHGARNSERYMSPRYQGKWLTFDAERWDKKIMELKEQFKGDEEGLSRAIASMQFDKSTSLQDVELEGWGLLETDFGPEADHVRIHPLLHWDEINVWEYLRDRKIPFNPLYRADYVEKAYGLKGKRYRSLGCKCCTNPIDSSASTIDEIIEELKTTQTEERSGRQQDKEKMYAMANLRSMGYL